MSPQAPRPPIDWDTLLAAARAARERAWAPFSGYPVGAAVLAEDGSIHAYGNVEYGIPALSLCAERLAVSAAIASGHRDLVALVVITRSKPPAKPCGLCRQTLAEAVEDLPILCLNEDGERVETRLSELLPAPFRFAGER